MKTRIGLVVLVAVGCGGAQTMEAQIPPAGRPMWEQCNSALSAWCHRQGQGDPTLDRDCEDNAARDYGRLADDPARRQFLTGRGCSL